MAAPTGRRHGWPRKDEGYRLYRERAGSYILVDPDKQALRLGSYDAVVNVHKGPRPSLCSGSVSPDYIFAGGVKRVQWSELPEEWQKAFRAYMGNDPENPFVPEKVRGLWLVNAIR